MLSLIASITNSKTDNKLKYITKERKAWRTKIRQICWMFDEGKEINFILTNIKTYINTYGYNKTIKCFPDSCNCNTKNRIETDYFMTDGHIWRIIKKLELEEDTPNKNFYINQLKLYLCKLVKYDWDRSKQEVIGNRQSLYSWLLFAFSEIFLIINLFYFEIFIKAMPTAGTKAQCDILFHVFIYALLFFVPYFISNFPRIHLIYNDMVSKKTVFLMCGISLLILMIVICVIERKDAPSQLLWLIFPLLVQMLAVAVNCASQVKKFDGIKKYVDDIKEIDEVFWAEMNDTTSLKNGN